MGASRLLRLTLLCTCLAGLQNSFGFAFTCPSPSSGARIRPGVSKTPKRLYAHDARYVDNANSQAPARLALVVGSVSLSVLVLRRSRVLRLAGFGGGGLSGKWGCYKTEGDIDAYWKAAGLPWLARKGLQLMDWGAGKNQNVREFTQKEDDIQMEYSFQGPGLGGLGFTEKYKVGDGIQEITRMGGAKIYVEPVWESDSILRITNMSPAKQTQGWTKSVLGGSKDEEANRDASTNETAAEGGEVIDVHRFYLEQDSLILEADSSPSGGPVVKWFLQKLD